ncbi:hypothetical protein [Streptomyces sp. AMCC400023]|uniref:hypothetical protein n=1 Tax=Streptomyces sp. AMCC400023 TaxID=2056258 RepID=UPI001F20C93E|nr:hypothetical protein [Streptomyces sp. AMCC400023]UJV42930.1 hypothetical protein CVT30_26585 [Streptomyces sp. AMCC400023]
MTSPNTDPSAIAPLVVGEALAHAVAGDLEKGCMLLVPLIEEGRRSCYALAAMLAETASHIARRDQEPGTAFGITVEDTVTGEAASVDVMPPDLRWAAQFTTAWANRDRDTALALFETLAERSEAADGAELVDGLLQLFGMAVATSKEVCAEQRAHRTNPEGDSTP